MLTNTIIIILIHTSVIHLGHRKAIATVSKPFTVQLLEAWRTWKVSTGFGIFRGVEAAEIGAQKFDG